jgi:hypothetical protein
VGKYGTNLEGFGAFEGGVNADKGAPLVSTSSDSETALLFGPAALREIQAGVANGDFAIPPDAAGDTITEENPLPYWTFTDVNSAGAITAAIIADAGAGSGNILRFTVAAGTTTGKSVTLSRFVPVASSASRSFAFYAEATFESGTDTYQAVAKLTGQFYKGDQTTTTGDELFSDDYRFERLQTPTGITAPNLYGVAPDLTVMTAPADAAFLKLTITITTTTAPVSNVARTLTTATVTTIGVHGFAIGQSATVSLTSGPSGYTALNGTWTITGTPTPTTFTFTTVTSGTITSGAAIGTVAVPAATARTVDLTEVRLANGLPEIILTDKENPATYPPGLITSEFGELILTSGSQDAMVVGPTSGIVAQTEIYLNSGGDIALNPEVGSAVNVNGDLTATGDMSANGIGVNFLWGDPAKTGPVFQLAGTNERFWTGTSSAGAADLGASNSTTRAGVLVTKPCSGQPTTNINGTGNTDAFADALRNGGLAIDTTNNRGYWYSSGWKYTALTTPSDSRLKEEITNITGALDTLRQLVPVAFKWKEPEAHGRTDCVSDDGTRMGFIADQVATTDLAHWVETLGVDDREAHLVDTTEVLAVNIPQNEMEALLVQALLDIDARLKALEEA